MYKINRFITILITLTGILFTSCSKDISHNDTQKDVVKIGVPGLSSEDFKYDILKSDLESKLGIKIEYVDLYANLENMNNNNDYVNNIDNLLKNNKIDMCLGVPSYQLEKIIDNGRLLDITDNIEEIDKIHKGVLDISRKMGNGKLYFVSPVMHDIYLVFQNEKILNEINDSIPMYISWNDFLEHLNNNTQVLNDKKLKYYPIALAVKNIGDDNLFIGYSFFMQALGLDMKIIEDNKFTKTTKEFYKTFATIVSKYGKDYKEFENGAYQKDYIFTNGNYTYMLGETYDLESFFNKDLNNSLNENAPIEIKIKFPVKISFINFDGSKSQNLRDTSVFINKNTVNKDLCILILNTLLSEEYAYKIIKNRGEYSHFTSSRFAYPTYYNKNTIAELNKNYDGKFDVSLLYDVEYGNVIYNNDIDMGALINALNDGFTEIYNIKTEDDIDDELESSISNIEAKLGLLK